MVFHGAVEWHEVMWSQPGGRLEGRGGHPTPGVLQKSAEVVDCAGVDGKTSLQRSERMCKERDWAFQVGVRPFACLRMALDEGVYRACTVNCEVSL